MDKFKILLSQLDKNSIKYTNSKYEIELCDEESFETIGIKEIPAVSIEIGRGRRIENIFIEENSLYLDDYVNSNIFDYKFIDGYDAIWSSKISSIECQLICRFPNGRLFERIKRIMVENNTSIDKINPIDLKCESKEIYLYNIGNYSISLSNASIEFLLLNKDKLRFRSNITDYADRILTLRIDNCDVSTHDQAKEILERIGFTTVFLLSEARLPIKNISVEKNGIYIPKTRSGSKISSSSLTIKPPYYEYDIQAVSLYLHAKSKETMPLYSFLAFYQVLEYYFPKYSEQKIKSELKRMLKDPKLDIENQSHLNEIINLTKSSRTNSFGDEISQLKETILGCNNPIELYEFLLTLDSNEYFSEKKKGKISSKKINVKQENTSIIEQITERIYDIRCNIVHKKATFLEQNNSILPNTIGYSDIYPDLELMEYLAYKTIIENSKKLII